MISVTTDELCAKIVRPIERLLPDIGRILGMEIERQPPGDVQPAVGTNRGAVRRPVVDVGEPAGPHPVSEQGIDHKEVTRASRNVPSADAVTARHAAETGRHLEPPEAAVQAVQSRGERSVPVGSTRTPAPRSEVDAPARAGGGRAPRPSGEAPESPGDTELSPSRRRADVASSTASGDADSGRAKRVEVPSPPAVGKALAPTTDPFSFPRSTKPAMSRSGMAAVSSAAPRRADPPNSEGSPSVRSIRSRGFRSPVDAASSAELEQRGSVGTGGSVPSGPTNPPPFQSEVDPPPLLPGLQTPRTDDITRSESRDRANQPVEAVPGDDPVKPHRVLAPVSVSVDWDGRPRRSSRRTGMAGTKAEFGNRADEKRTERSEVGGEGHDCATQDPARVGKTVKGIPSRSDLRLLPRTPADAFRAVREELSVTGASAPSVEAPHSLGTSLVPRRVARLTNRVAVGMRPVFDAAHAITSDALAAPESSSEAGGQAGSAKVQNTFHVNVAVGRNGRPADLDPHAFEDALVTVLRDAARRHGLEV